MIITVYPIMMVELFALFGSMTRLLYFFALAATYNIAEALYHAYFGLGMLAYLVALLGYLPFLISLFRMTWRDTEARRLIFYHNCLKLYGLVAAIDLWVCLSTSTKTTEYCMLTDFMPNESIILEHFNLSGRIPKDTLLLLCNYRFAMFRFFSMMGSRLQYAIMIYLSRTHWQVKH